MKKSLLFIALAAVLLSFSSWNETEESTSIPYGHPDSTVKASLKILEKKYSAIPYFAKLDDQYLFYVVNGQWIDTSRTEFAKGKFLMGLVNEKGEVVLPVEYTKLYNPDATARGYIEIEKNGKRGLFNYHTRKVIAAEYDVIFEREDLWDAIAVGRIGTEFYKILSDGVRKPYIVVEHWDNQKLYYLLGQSKKLSKECKDQEIFELMPKFNVWNEDTAKIRGVYITPSYLFSVKYDEKFSELDLKLNFYGTNDIEYQNSYSWERNNNVISFINTFVERGIMERGWTIEQNTIVTTDSVGRLLDCIKIKEDDVLEYFGIYGGNSADIHNQDLYNINVENDSIVSVKRLDVSIKGLEKYDVCTFYFFYFIDAHGQVDRLESNRIFDMTKYIQMQEYDFNGVFITDTVKDDDDASGYGGDGLVKFHLSLEDLELMRNEIFADYGYKFKTEKWKKYFSKQRWYQGKYDNVDAFLTAIDKHNLDLILRVEAEMKKDEKLFTKPIYSSYGWGGP